MTITPDTLAAALAAAQPGATLKLVGTFGDIVLRGDKHAEGLMLDLADAEVAGSWKAMSMTGLRLVGGTWRGKHPLRLDGCADVRVTGGVFEGPGAHDANLADGYAVFVLRGRGVTVEGVRAEGFKGGVVLSKVDGFAVTGCGLSRMRSDGIQAGESRNGLIARNEIHGTKTLGVGEHPDGIQLWSRATSPPAADIVIEDNLIVGGDTQGVGCFNIVNRLYKAGTVLADGSVLAQGARLNDGGYDRITIRRNRVVAGHPQGIGLVDARDSAVTDNVVSTYAGSRWRASIGLTRCERTVRSRNRVGPGGGLPGLDDPDVGEVAP